MIKSLNKIFRILVVVSLLFFMAGPYIGAAYAADDKAIAAAKVWTDKAYEAASAGKYDEVISCADKAIGIKPDHANAYNARGYAHYKKKQFKEAVEDYDTVIKFKPDFPTAYVNRGSAKFYLGLYDSCIEDQNKAMELSSDDSNAYFFRGKAYHEKKLYDQAIGDYTRALEIEPQASVYSRRADAYLDRGEYEKAVKDMKKAVILAPDDEKLKKKLEKLEGRTVAGDFPVPASEGVNVLLMAPGYNGEWEGVKDRDSIQHQFKYIFFPATLEEIVETVRKVGSKERIQKLVFLGHGDPGGNVIDLGDGVGFASPAMDGIADKLRKEGDSSVLDAFADNAEIIYLNCMAGLQPKLLTSTAELFLAFSGGTVYGSEQYVMSDLNTKNTIFTMLSYGLPFLADAVNFTGPSQTDYHTFWNRSLAPFPYRDFKTQLKVAINGPDSANVGEKAVLEGAILDQKAVPVEVRPFLKYVWKCERTITVDGKKRAQVLRNIRKESVIMDTSAPTSWRVEAELFLDNGIGARKLGIANHIFFVEKMEDVAIDLSSKEIVLGKVYTARAYITDGATPENAMWVWKGEGGVHIEKKEDDVVHFTVDGAGRLSAQLFTVGTFGKDKVLGAAGIPIKLGATQSDGTPTVDKSSDAAASITVNVEKTSPPTDTITVGEKARFKAAVAPGASQTAGDINFQWQPYPEIEFEPFEKSATTTATFRKPGTYNIFVQALTKDGETIGRSNIVAITVVNPVWKMEFGPEAPLIGQEVKAKISPPSTANIDMKEMNFRWELSANARQTGTSKDDREITFYLTDGEGANISCFVSTKYENESLGGVSKAITAKAYNVTIKGPRSRQGLQKWLSNTQLGGAASTGMKKAVSPYVVGQEILFSAGIDPVPGKPVSYDWTASPDDCTFNSNGGKDTSITCRSMASYTVKVTARMDGMEIGSATSGVSVGEAQDETVKPPVAKKTADRKVSWGPLPSGWKVHDGQIQIDQPSNQIAGTGERALVDNPGFANNLYFRYVEEPIPGYKLLAIVEVGRAVESDFSTQEKITARFMDGKGRMTPGFQGTKECKFQGCRAIRYDVGSPKSTRKEWGYFIEVDPERNLWSAVMCHVNVSYEGPSDKRPSNEDRFEKRDGLEQNANRLLEKSIRITQ